MLSMKIFLEDPNLIYTIETRIEQSTEIVDWCGRIAYHNLEYGIPCPPDFKAEPLRH